MSKLIVRECNALRAMLPSTMSRTWAATQRSWRLNECHRLKNVKMGENFFPTKNCTIKRSHLVFKSGPKLALTTGGKTVLNHSFCQPQVTRLRFFHFTDIFSFLKISLMLSYKITAKIIANRLQLLFMSKLVDPHQTGFIFGRHTQDIIIICLQVGKRVCQINK